MSFDMTQIVIALDRPWFMKSRGAVFDFKAREWRRVS